MRDKILSFICPFESETLFVSSVQMCLRYPYTKKQKRTTKWFVANSVIAISVRGAERKDHLHFVTNFQLLVITHHDNCKWANVCSKFHCTIFSSLHRTYTCTFDEFKLKWARTVQALYKFQGVCELFFRISSYFKCEWVIKCCFVQTDHLSKMCLTVVIFFFRSSFWFSALCLLFYHKCEYGFVLLHRPLNKFGVSNENSLCIEFEIYEAKSALNGSFFITRSTQRNIIITNFYYFLVLFYRIVRKFVDTQEYKIKQI